MKQGQLQRIHVVNCTNFTANISAVIIHAWFPFTLNIAEIFGKYAFFESCSGGFQHNLCDCWGCAADNF